MEIFKKLGYKILWYGYCAWIEFLYCEWNPWALARLNLAWTNYTKTPMYEERMKLDWVDIKGFDNYAEKAFVENLEIKLFTSLFTKTDRLRITFLPFSCGNKHTMPWFLIRNRIIIMFAWVIGIKEED